VILTAVSVARPTSIDGVAALQKPFEREALLSALPAHAKRYDDVF
jgi:hypothetical protein